jgi:hypothetical protein
MRLGGESFRTHSPDAPAIRRRKKLLGLRVREPCWLRLVGRGKLPFGPLSSCPGVRCIRNGVFISISVALPRSAPGSKQCSSLAAVSHRRPCPLSPLGRPTTGVRAPLIRFFFPSAFLGRVALNSGAAGLRIIPLRHSALQRNWCFDSTPHRLPLRSFCPAQTIVQDQVYTCHTWASCASRSGSCIVAYLTARCSATRCFGTSRGLAGMYVPGSAHGILPFAVLTRPMRVGAFSPVSPTCRFLADPHRRYRSKDQAALEFHPHAEQSAR